MSWPEFASVAEAAVLPEAIWLIPVTTDAEAKAEVPAAFASAATESTLLLVSSAVAAPWVE